MPEDPNAGLFRRRKLAQALVVEPKPDLAERAYLVSGHWVNLGDEMVDDCDCADFLYRGGPCKHVIAVQNWERENAEQIEDSDQAGDEDRDTEGSGGDSLG